MDADDRYVALAAKLALFDDEITKFLNAETGFSTRPPTIQKPDRDNCKKAAVITAKNLRGSVQEMANADNGHAESIIKGANMLVKVHTPRQKQTSKVKDTSQSGIVIVYGDGDGPHEWLKSDDGINYTPLNATRSSRKKVTGLTVGKTYYFKSRKILTHDDYGPWSFPVDVVAR
jgi:hypothetical protein